MKKLLEISLAVWVVLYSGFVFAQSDQKTLTLAVSEGTSGGIDNAAAQKKYRKLADAIGKVLGRTVNIALVREFGRLEDGMKARQYEIVMARPSDYPARGVRDYGYYFIATAEPSGHCELIVRKDSPLKSVKDLQGHYLILPEKVAYMTKFCVAALRDEGVKLDESHTYYVKEQGAIPFSLLNGLADVGGIASYSGAYKKWKQSGHRVLFESRPQPYFPVIASNNLDESERRKLQQTLLGLNSSEDGQSVLASLEMTGFGNSQEAKLGQLLDWLSVN